MSKSTALFKGTLHISEILGFFKQNVSLLEKIIKKLWIVVFLQHLF